MDLAELLLQKLEIYGIGRRKLDDELFVNDKPPLRLGVYDVDDESLCHEVVKSTCNIPGCKFAADSLLEFENHYNAVHRYSCSQCKKVLPSPHHLDLHIQETHDSFFAVLATRKPSFSCYIEDCKEKFTTTDERRDHCVKVHRLPKDFRFDRKPKPLKQKKPSTKTDSLMEVDKEKVFSFNNSKGKAFSKTPKYSGKRFTKDSSVTAQDVNMDDAMNDLRKNLPE